MYLKNHVNKKISANKELSISIFTCTTSRQSTEQLKQSAVANAIAISLLLCFSCFVLLRHAGSQKT